MKLVFLLLMNLFISSVTTFNPIEWVKDAVKYEHCGSIWIKPDTDGNFIISCLAKRPGMKMGQQ